MARAGRARHSVFGYQCKPPRNAGKHGTTCQKGWMPMHLQPMKRHILPACESSIVIPEPSTWVLVAVLLPLMLRRRRKA